MTSRPRLLTFFLLLAFPPLLPHALSQTAGAAHAHANGALHGQVTDPSGAIIPGATVQLSSPTQNYTAHTGADGVYTFKGLTAGTYTLSVTETGFTPYAEPGIIVVGGTSRALNVPMAIAVEQQEVQVTAEGNTVDTSPDNNVSAITITGKDLDALSDDPDELQNQLSALAGPAAGPNGGEVYIDGFTGGQLPPKSAIREIRVNQNPFSAEYDKLGYGRIEILTKPGTEKLHGSVQGSGNTSAFNALNPFANPNSDNPNIPPQPPYHSYRLQGSVSTALSKRLSVFVSTFYRTRQDQNIVVASVPAADPKTDPAGLGVAFNQAYINPNSRTEISPRFDFQINDRNTLTGRYSFHRVEDNNDGFGGSTLQSQAFSLHNVENTFQLGDTQVISPRLINEMRFRYRRVRDDETSANSAPSVNVQGDFSSGGNNTGTVRDNQDQYEIQNYTTATLKNHGLRFGARLRILRDSNYANSGQNGNFIFPSMSSYYAGAPTQYSATIINNPSAKATIFDAGLFYQDDWKVNQKLTVSYGLRFESQNQINDHADWGPRLGIAYALDGRGKRPAKTVLRAGYGWFYDRFIVPSYFSSNNGTPYAIQTIQENGINQQDYVVKSGLPASNGAQYIDPRTLPGAGQRQPTIYNIDPHFRAALNMQTAVGVDRQISRNITGNVTYLYSRGIHHYLSENVNAPAIFDPNTGEGTDRPCETNPLAVPGGCPAGYTGNVYQFQSGAVYNQSELIFTGNARMKRFNLFGFYVLNSAKADTDGATYFPSHPGQPGLDYGRAGWDTRNRLMLLGNLQLPYQLSLTPIFAANSGNPFNLVIGQDINGDNQYNDRPAYAPASACQSGAAGNYATRFGCLTSNVTAASPSVPYDLGTGPSNYSLNLRVSKVVGIGPRVGEGAGAGTGDGGGPHGGGHGLGTRGLSGNSGGPGKLDQSAPRKYNIVLVAYGANLFNHLNLDTPNGTLTSSRFFDRSQGLAGGFFSPPYPGNRAIDFQASFNF